MRPRKTQLPRECIDQPEDGGGLALHLSSGVTETVARAASISFERGQVVCRDRDGRPLRTVSASGLAFATHALNIGSLNVWI